MTNIEWKRLVERVKAKGNVVEENIETTENGIIKDVLVVEGERGQTRFERYQRPDISENPTDLFREDEFLYNTQALGTYVRVFRRTTVNDPWQELSLGEVLGFKYAVGEVVPPATIEPYRRKKPDRRYRY
ncbi:MAG: hypothetical protein V1707_00525 [bacterium]